MVARQPRQPTHPVAEPLADLAHLRAENAGLRAENATLRAENATLQATVAELRAALATLQQTQQMQADQLRTLQQRPFAPPKRPDPPPAPATRGRPAGHPGSSRVRPTRIDQIQVVATDPTCPTCGTTCTGSGVMRERVVEDIDLTRPTVITKYVIERRWCPQCRTYHESPVTAALPHQRLGWHMQLFVVYQKVAMGLSYGKIQRELRTYFGLTVSAGELPSIVAEIAALFGPAYARLIATMRQQAALHIDETSWRINGVVHWLWVFVNDVVALYVMSRSRGSKVPQALLGPDFDGVIVTDFFSAYSPLEVDKAKCWAHLLRDSHDAARGQPPDHERTRFHTDLHALYLDMGLALEQVAADPAGREAVADELHARLWRFAAQHWRDDRCQQLAARITKYVDDLVMWLAEPAVAATNNTAEQALRGAVVTRKTSFGSRSKRGALAFARLLSVITTMEKQGEDFFTAAQPTLTAACS